MNSPDLICTQLRQAAAALESWWRSQPVTFAYDVTPGGSVRVVAGDGSKWQCSQPEPALRMTPELERVLEAAEEAECSIRTGFRLHSDGERHWKIREAIAAVRAQASQPQRVKLPRVREALERAKATLCDERIGTIDYMDGSVIYSDFARCADGIDAALAELDAVEGRKP